VVDDIKESPKNILKLDQKPIQSVQKKILLHFIEEDLKNKLVKKILDNLLKNAETRGIIKSIRTQSCRTFGTLFYICYHYGDPPEKDPFQ
jgi:signal recognition particle GTPase